MREVLDAAVPTHPAKCVFIVTKMFLIILVMISGALSKVMILTEKKYQTERQLCPYISFIWIEFRDLGSPSPI